MCDAALVSTGEQGGTGRVMTQNSLGICLGASNIKIVELTREGDEIRVTKRISRNHESNPREVFQALVEEHEIGSCDFGALTGRKFRDMVKAVAITEPEAIEQALSFIYDHVEGAPRHRSLVSLGAENFIAYLLTHQGNVSAIETGNKCASGTGEFFNQQIKRMDIDTSSAIDLATDSPIYSVSGRCSVFCKSDCTHALNKGIPIGRVTAGLCKMMAEKVVDLLEKLDHKKVIAVGGVTKNTVVMDHLRGMVDDLYIPPDADTFEALGAAYHALTNEIVLGLDPENLFEDRKYSFTFLPPIAEAEPLVEFKSFEKGTVQAGDRCIIGLDVGSTTTKSVVLRTNDDAVLASTYLRTNGDPVGASRNCYRAMTEQLGEKIDIVGLGVTGSGRHISGLHAGTQAIINEIIAHATGATYFDPKVDTIFEIGGQDAKYTHMTNAVPSDYAMNEACSAGTGSFLEESAYESLGIDYKKIQDVALLGMNPPNFNDQCAAFISSDIKTATHEGINKEDIVAGLVYSICMNYTNRVKGQRPIGDRIFMQGGVCYNKAVPLAMANLIERKIVVPPDPGLIGAFGVALETKNRIDTGLLEASSFDLAELAAREIEYGRTFKCKGGKQRCDRGCEINMTVIQGKRRPFGGACNRYYNRRFKISLDTKALDLVRQRQDLVFDRQAPPARGGGKITVGMNRSYLVNTFYPLYHTFFSNLGCDVILANEVDPDGIKKRRSSFCYPGELAHGFYHSLLRRDDLDYIFMPKIMSMRVQNADYTARERQATCVLLQSESYYLSSAFKDVPTRAKLLTPLLDFAGGFESQKEIFVELAKELGKSRRDALAAYRLAMDAQLDVVRRMKGIGRRVVRELEQTPEKSAVVLFGRSYNAFAKEANMGIPTKFASRGSLVIPWDFLSFEDQEGQEDMCWAVGQDLLKAAQLVKEHPQLFGAYVTNFSCGPDSFLLGYFREIMKTKPSLTLELDSHTADAGVDTRIEAFLDIVQRYRELQQGDAPAKAFTPARVEFEKGLPIYVTSDGERVSFSDKRVHMMIPSMGRLGSEVLAAGFQGFGIRADAIPVYTFDDVKLGRANASCKECLPLLLVTGGILKYLEQREDDDELLAYFMPFTPGNCRFPQYRVFLNKLVEKRGLKNVTLFSMTAEKGYTYEAFGPIERVNILRAFITSDVMEDIRNALLALAVDQEDAIEAFEEQWSRVLAVFSESRAKDLYRTLEDVSTTLSRIPLKRPLAEAKKVELMGEVFVRRDYFSCGDLMDRLIDNEIVVKKSHFFEWLKYVDTIIKKGIYEPNFGVKDQIQFDVKMHLQHHYEKKIKEILAKSKLYDFEIIDIEKILEYGKNFFDVRFRGESILVTGNFFKNILHESHGMVSIGPFACMPSRVIEAVLSAEATMDVKRQVEPHNAEYWSQFDDLTELPFLSIETDGNPFPQILEARIEAFCLQVDRLHRRLEGVAPPPHEPPKTKWLSMLRGS